MAVFRKIIGFVLVRSLDNVTIPWFAIRGLALAIRSTYVPNLKSLSLPTTQIRKAYKIAKIGWFGVVKGHSSSLE